VFITMFDEAYADRAAFPVMPLQPGRAAPTIASQPCVLFGTICGFDSVGTFIAE
jgi:hypothetical protein